MRVTGFSYSINSRDGDQVQRSQSPNRLIGALGCGHRSSPVVLAEGSGPVKSQSLVRGGEEGAQPDCSPAFSASFEPRTPLGGVESEPLRPPPLLGSVQWGAGAQLLWQTPAHVSDTLGVAPNGRPYTATHWKQLGGTCGLAREVSEGEYEKYPHHCQGPTLAASGVGKGKTPLLRTILPRSNRTFWTMMGQS